MRVLISGAGIAGPTLAYWLARYGIEATLVESAASLRTGGYVVDFWGLGMEVARRMGILANVLQKGYSIREVRIVADDGTPVVSFPAAAFAGVSPGGFTSLPRGDLAAAVFASLPASVETLFDETIERIEQNSRCASVTFRRQPPREFDLVVGADGLHSRVRELVFGQEATFERYLGLKVAAFAVDGYQPRDELVYVMYTQVGQQAARFAMRDGRTMFLFTFADPDPALPEELDERKRLLRARFASSGWECPRILETLDPVRELYFDRVSQVIVGPEHGGWRRGRVTLLGDAASCISLAGGQGSALAMTAAYMLAGELRAVESAPATAIWNYEQRFRPFVTRKQRAARWFASGFAPGSGTAIVVRNAVLGALSVEWIGSLLGRTSVADRLVLPVY